MRNVTITRTRPGAFLLIIGVLLPAFAMGTEPDSLSYELQEIEVVAPGQNHSSRKRGATEIKAESLQTRARVLGEADILGALKQESGVSFASEYGSGISFEGADPYQSMFRLDGAPVFFPYRFGGIFSTFNTGQLGTVRLWREGYPGVAPTRAGTAVDLFSADPTGKPTYAMGNLGLMASSATVRQSLGKRCGFTLSGRVSYMNLLYRKFLKAEDYQLGYDFADLNMAFFWHPDDKSLFSASLFWNHDLLKMEEREMELDMRLGWHNETAALSYSRTGDTVELEANAWLSGFGSRMEVNIPGMDMKLPAKVKSAGIGVSAGFKTGWNLIDKVYFFGGASLYRITPQYPEGSEVEEVVSQSQRPFEAKGGVEVHFNLPGQIGMKIQGEGAAYGLDDYKLAALLPSLELSRSVGRSELRLGGRRTLQTLHQVGFSEIGLASNYWIGSSKRLPAQKGWKVSGSWTWHMPWHGLQLVADAYYGTIDNQPVYVSGLLTVLNPDYGPEENLELCAGWNAGAGIELRKDFGNLNGKLRVSYSKNRRHFDGSREWWTGNYDRGVQAGVEINWLPSRHWILGAVFNFASGRVYTPVRGVYMLSGNIASIYGKRNSARLGNYQRLDLSATYVLPKKGGRLRHLINFSLLNAYGHKNLEMQYYRINYKSSVFNTKRIFSLYRFLPSLSYTIELK